MSILWHVGALLSGADQAPAPEDVKAGWVALGLFLLLAAAVVFLAFSFRKQLRKIDFDEDGEADRSPEGDGSSTHRD